MSKKSLTIVVSIISVCILLYCGIRDPQETESLEEGSEQIVSDDVSESSCSDRLQKLELANRKLNAEMRKMRAVMHTLVDDTRNVAPADDDDNPTEDGPAIPPQSDEEMVEDARNEEQAEIAALEERIYSGGYSRQISEDVFYRMEDILRDMGMADARMLSAACNANVCKLEVEHDSSEEENQEQFMKVATEYAPIENAAVVVPSPSDDEVDNSILNIFYIRENTPYSEAAQEGQSEN